MAETFEAALARVKSFQLGTLGEEAIKQGVILPLLRTVGWDTDDISQVNPEYQTGKGFVDYSLRIGDENRVFVEAKAGGVDLKFCENQLQEYCRATKPILAVLTNGGHWWLYVPTTSKRVPVGRFLEFDVNDELGKLETNFREFLARDNLSERLVADRTAKKARKLLREGRITAKVVGDLTVAWNELSADRQAMIDLVSKFAEEREIQPSLEQVRLFLDSNKSLLNKAEKVKPPPPPKPESFTFEAGDDRVQEKVKKHSWKELTVRVCELMHERRPGMFNEVVLEMPKSFSTARGDPKKPIQIGETGVYLGWSNAKRFEEISKKVVVGCGYPKESLTIQDKNGEDFQA
jgi:hypothetical protein